MKTQGIIALDNLTFLQANAIARKVQGRVFGFKGNDLLDGDESPKKVVSHFRKFGAFFVDIKAHDIPDTVANRVRKYASHGASLITVHGSGGLKMIRAAVDTYEKCKPEDGLGILVVTVLTSLSDDDCYATYGALKPVEAVMRFARWAEEAGAYGIVSSPKELTGLRGKFTGLKRVTPGVRSVSINVHDQVRIDTPANAVKNGADYLVIGRQVTEAADPVQAVAEIDAELAAGCGVG